MFGDLTGTTGGPVICESPQETGRKLAEPEEDESTSSTGSADDWSPEPERRDRPPGSSALKGSKLSRHLPSDAQTADIGGLPADDEKDPHVSTLVVARKSGSSFERANASVGPAEDVPRVLSDTRSSPETDCLPADEQCIGDTALLANGVAGENVTAGRTQSFDDMIAEKVARMTDDEKAQFVESLLGLLTGKAHEAAAILLDTGGFKLYTVLCRVNRRFNAAMHYAGLDRKFRELVIFDSPGKDDLTRTPCSPSREVWQRTLGHELVGQMSRTNFLMMARFFAQEIIKDSVSCSDKSGRITLAELNKELKLVSDDTAKRLQRWRSQGWLMLGLLDGRIRKDVLDELSLILEKYSNLIVDDWSSKSSDAFNNKKIQILSAAREAAKPAWDAYYDGRINQEGVVRPQDWAGSLPAQGDKVHYRVNLHDFTVADGHALYLAGFYREHNVIPAPGPTPKVRTAAEEQAWVNKISARYFRQKASMEATQDALKRDAALRRQFFAQQYPVSHEQDLFSRLKERCQPL